MDESYVAQLYDLYRKGKEACSIFQAEIHRLATNIDLEKQMFAWSDKERDIFANTFKRLDQLASDWYISVMDILNRIPLVSPKTHFSADVKTATSELRALYPQYANINNLKVILRLYDKLKTRVERLPNVITSCEQFQRESDDTPKKRGRKAALYRLTYNDMTGILFVNDIAVHKCNIDSELDKAIRKALKTPGKKVAVRGSLRSIISRTKIPKDLQKLMFITGKGILRMQPEITASDLSKAGFERTKIDSELQKLL